MKVPIILLLAWVFVAVVGENCDVKGYYWREFSGRIPKDAIAGGSDEYGNPIYVGQVFDLKYLIPAQICINEKRAYYVSDNKEEKTMQNNTQILCGVKPDDFIWLETTMDALPTLIKEKTQLIFGGYQPGWSTYIGRIRSWGNVLIGKVLLGQDRENDGLFVTRNGEVERHTKFNILAFKGNESDAAHLDRCA